MKTEKGKIILETPVHKACAVESDLYDHDCVRVLPVPGKERAVAVGFNGTIVAIGRAVADRPTIIPSKALPKTMSAPFELDIAGKVEDLVAGRIDVGKKKALFVFEEKGDAKLRVGLDFLRQHVEHVREGLGVRVAVDVESLYQLASAITRAGAAVGTVTMYVENDQPIVVVGSAGVGLVQTDDVRAKEVRVDDVLAEYVDDLTRAYARSSGPVKGARRAVEDELPLLDAKPAQLALPSPDQVKSKPVENTARKPGRKGGAGRKGGKGKKGGKR